MCGVCGCEVYVLGVGNRNDFGGVIVGVSFAVGAIQH